MGIIRPTNIVHEEWGWDPDKMDWTNDKNVSCLNNQFQTKDKSMCYASIKRGEQHGWTTASSEYYYYIIEGSGQLEVEGEEPITIKQGDAFCVETGTKYNYWSSNEEDLRFVLFLSKMWSEE